MQKALASGAPGSLQLSPVTPSWTGGVPPSVPSPGRRGNHLCWPLHSIFPSYATVLKMIIILKLRFRSCVKCMALFLPYRSHQFLYCRAQLFCAKACENTIEVYDGAREAGRIIALVSRTQNTANTDEKINNRFIILSPLKCAIVVPMYWLDRST